MTIFKKKTYTVSKRNLFLFMYLPFPVEKNECCLSVISLFCFKSKLKSLVCEHLFIHVMRFRGRPFNLQGCLCFYPKQTFQKHSYNPTARQSDSQLVQQSDSSTVRQSDIDVFVFQLHLSSKNSNKVRIRGSTSKDLKLQLSQFS